MDQNPYVSPVEFQGKVKSSWIWSVFKIGGTFAILLLVLSLFLPPVTRSREAARRTQCKNNLKQIGLAIANYYDDYGAFPPAYTTDAGGRRLHSWRTLLLPYVDQRPLYGQIDLSKPWDDPVNQAIFNSARPVTVYMCPSSARPSNLTAYVAIVGQKSCFSPGETLKIADIRDGASRTVMIVEVDHGISIPWMAPDDIDDGQLIRFNSGSREHHVGGFHSLLADGSVRFINRNIGNATLLGLTTRNGDEVIENF